MTKRIDHAEIAQLKDDMAGDETDPKWATALALRATESAVLALVEQQRIANIIALEMATEPSLGDSYLLFGTYPPEGSVKDVRWEMRPEIREVLGL